MNIFKRLFRIGAAETNSLVDKLEDPIKMTEQGIRDLLACCEPSGLTSWFILKPSEFVSDVYDKV